jgi:hypothetical protein
VNQAASTRCRRSCTADAEAATVQTSATSCSTMAARTYGSGHAPTNLPPRAPHNPNRVLLLQRTCASSACSTSCSSRPSGVSSAGGSCACSAANSSPLLPLPPPSQAALLAASPTDGHSSKPAHVRVGVEHDITAAGSEQLRFLEHTAGAVPHIIDLNSQRAPVCAMNAVHAP